MKTISLTDDEFFEVKAAVQYRMEEIVASGEDQPTVLVAASRKLKEVAQNKSTPDWHEEYLNASADAAKFAAENIQLRQKLKE